MDFGDFEWSQGAPTPLTMSETMCDMFLFRKKKKHFLMKKYFLHFPLLYSYAKTWDHSKSSKSMIFGKNQCKSWFFMRSVIFVMELDSSIAVEQCKVRKNIFHKKMFFSCETKTCHTSFLTLWRVWEHLGTTQNHQNP